MSETTFQRIIRKSGLKPSNCKCELCKSQCKVPCLGTPEDMEKILIAGFGERLEKVIIEGALIVRSKLDAQKKSCTFFTNGLCELHDLGLKPTVGKLSHHTSTPKNLKSKNHWPSILVLAEWKKINQKGHESQQEPSY